MKELRRYPRIQTNLDSTLNSTTNTGISKNVTIKDLSLGGFKIYLNNTVKPESLKSKKLNVRIPFSGNSSEINEEIEIVWTNSHFAGVRFTHLSSNSEKLLQELFPAIKKLPIKVPHNTRYDYDENFIQQRRKWLEQKTNTQLKHIAHYSQPTGDLKGNIEQFIGVTQVPIGIAGPLKINGENAQGEFYVPLATTEGALVMTYNRGMRVLTEAENVMTRVIDDQIHISPVFILPFGSTFNFIEWIKTNFLKIKVEAEKTTNHGKLLKIEPRTFGKEIILKFAYYSSDAQGLNMINKATEAACKFIKTETGYNYRLRSNYSSVKKVSGSNIHTGYGKRVIAEAIIPAKALKYLKVNAQQMAEYFFGGTIADIEAGMIGNNCHISNGIAAMFLACGQDAADISSAHVGNFHCQVIDNDSLYACVHLPNLLVGTVGGGTGLGTQKECLEIMGCSGTGKAKKFAEIVAATALAGEIAVLAALATDSYVQAHEKYGRNRPKQIN